MVMISKLSKQRRGLKDYLTNCGDTICRSILLLFFSSSRPSAAVSMGRRWGRWARGARWAGGESETSWLTEGFAGGDCSCTFLLINHVSKALCGGPDDGWMEAGSRFKP